LVVQPNEKQTRGTRNAPIEKISQLEDLRKTQPSLKYDDLTKLELKSR
jgi:hypothetical protein